MEEKNYLFIKGDTQFLCQIRCHVCVSICVTLAVVPEMDIGKTGQGNNASFPRLRFCCIVRRQTTVTRSKQPDLPHSTTTVLTHAQEGRSPVSRAVSLLVTRLLDTQRRREVV